MKILEAKPQRDFQLWLRFDDGRFGTVDLSDFAGRGVFASWLHHGIFDQVRITEQGALEWPGEIDLCPDALYLRMTAKAAEEIFPRLMAHA